MRETLCILHQDNGQKSLFNKKERNEWPHIYERHIDLLSEQVNADISELENTRAKFILPESLDYFGTSLKDIQVVDYVHNGNYKYEIAI